MSRVYLIKPLEKKSIVYHVEMFRENADGSISWFNIDETYRWGQGFIEAGMDVNLPYEGMPVAYCKSDAGWGCEFDDSISIEFEFSDDLDQEEREAIHEAYHKGGSAWLYDGEHDWQEEDAAVHVIAPYQVSLCDELTGKVIEENVKLKPKPEPSNAWPFPT